MDTFSSFLSHRNSSATNIAMRKVAVSLADSVDLRIILSVLYIMTEVIRMEKVAGSSDFKEIAEIFTNELSEYRRQVLFETSVICGLFLKFQCLSFEFKCIFNRARNSDF